MRHLAVVSEKKVEMFKLILLPNKMKYYKWRYNNFLRINHLFYMYKHVQNIGVKFGASCW